MTEIPNGPILKNRLVANVELDILGLSIKLILETYILCRQKCLSSSHLRGREQSSTVRGAICALNYVLLRARGR